MDQENNGKASFFPIQGTRHKMYCMHRPIKKPMISRFIPTRAYPDTKGPACTDRSRHADKKDPAYTDRLRKNDEAYFLSNTGHTQTQKVMLAETDQDMPRQKRCCINRPITRTMMKPLFFPTQGIPKNTRSCMHRSIEKTMIKRFIFPTWGILRHKRSSMHRPIEKTMIKLRFFPICGIPDTKGPACTD